MLSVTGSTHCRCSDSTSYPTLRSPLEEFQSALWSSNWLLLSHFWSSVCTHLFRKQILNQVYQNAANSVFYGLFNENKYISDYTASNESLIREEQTSRKGLWWLNPETNWSHITQCLKIWTRHLPVARLKHYCFSQLYWVSLVYSSSSSRSEYSPQQFAANMPTLCYSFS